MDKSEPESWAKAREQASEHTQIGVCSTMHRTAEMQLAINIMARVWSNTLVAFALSRSHEGRQAQAKQNGKEFMGRMNSTRIVMRQAFPKAVNEDRQQCDKELSFWTCMLNCAKVMHYLQGGPQAVQQRARIQKIM